mgnify:FL=1
MRSSDQQAVRIPADQRGWTAGCDRASDLVSYDRRILRCFGVKSTDDLPVVGEEQVEDFKIQAQEEVKYTLDETSLEEEMEEM